MKRGYPVIDQMRLISAILVMTIHISPLANISPAGDFILTRIIARVAVPFFFMVTSYFLFLDGIPTINKVKKTLLSLAKWYFIATVCYLPLLLYNHYFAKKQLLVEIIRDILIDGTFYHLWYFPAVIIGIILVYWMKKYLPVPIALLLTILLYGIGLCGDSYYYFANNIPIIKNLLAFLFQYMDYTRNGFFFAPLFLMLGAIIADQKNKLNFNQSLNTFLISFAFMTLEATILHCLNLTKHDAMYITLPFTGYYLFKMLIIFKGRRYQRLKNISLYIYIFHPFLIVVVRMLGKLSQLSFLIQNAFIQFIAVLILSLTLALVIEKIKERI